MPATQKPVSFDRVAHEYDLTRGGSERARSCALDLIEHLPSGDVLEIGVGTGIVAEALRHELDRPCRIAGVDISAEMLNRARGRLPGTLVRASAQQLPFAAASFDAVIAVHVLHLVGDMQAALAEAARVLRPGGRVVTVHGEREHPEDELGRATRGLRGLGDRPDSRAAVAAAAAPAGLRLVAQHASLPQIGRHSPAELADLIRRRSWSSLWDLDEPTWRERVEPVLDALSALPDQDRPRVQEARGTVSALERV